MDRIYERAAVSVPPSPPASPSPGYPTDGNPQYAQAATRPGAHWHYMITEELINVMLAAGITPDHTQYNQLLQSIRLLGTTNLVFQSSTAFTTAGSSPQYTLTPQPPLTSYVAGQRYRVKFHAASVGNPTLNVSGLGALNVVQYDNTGLKEPSLLAAGQLTDVEFDGADWVVLNPLPTADASVGTLSFHAGTTPPAGKLVCNGAAISRVAYSRLFNVIGILYGAGDSVNTFNIPNVPDGDTLIAGVPASVGTSTSGQITRHTHGVTDPGHRHAPPDGKSNFVTNPGDWNGTAAGGSGNATYVGALTGASQTGISIGYAGTDTKNRAAGLKGLVCITY
jgi:microcystin-dependent protein